MRPEFVIAEREFREHFSSKRFLVIFGILILLIIFSLWTGIDSYNQQLSEYNSAVSSPGSPLDHVALSATSMPSVLQVFQSMVTLFTLTGMMLGISLGFDAISGEHDKGSIKFLISSPIYRDAIINGKTLGALITLGVAMGSAFIIAIAIMLFKSAVPSLDDLVRIAAFFLAALLYCMVFYAISLMMSTITKDTTAAVICSVWLIILLILFSYMAVQIGSAITSVVYGPAPMADQSTFDASNGNINSYITYVSREYQISNDIGMISPYGDFGGMMGTGAGGIGSALVSRTSTDITSDLSASTGTTTFQKVYSLEDSISSVMVQLIVLVIELVAAFSISYVAFMKMDIR